MLRNKSNNSKEPSEIIDQIIGSSPKSQKKLSPNTKSLYKSSLDSEEDPRDIKSPKNKLALRK